MKRVISSISTIVTLAILFALPTSVTAKEMSGKEIVFDRQFGNCLGCHMILDGALPGNIGPPLVAMKTRFPNKADLRAQIWDSTVQNPNSSMPPFGRHKVLSERQIDKVTNFIHSL